MNDPALIDVLLAGVGRAQLAGDLSTGRALPPSRFLGECRDLVPGEVQAGGLLRTCFQRGGS